MLVGLSSIQTISGSRGRDIESVSEIVDSSFISLAGSVRVREEPEAFLKTVLPLNMYSATLISKLFDPANSSSTLTLTGANVVFIKSANQVPTRRVIQRF